MDIKKSAVAGTLESNDVFVEIEESDTLKIEIESIVYAQFGEDIKNTVKDMLDKMDVKAAKVSLNDHGALDCVIRARLETAIKRASEVEA
ncbi:MAG: citrate lyase acyl carrier protein [Clostridia bacterium]|nr:citrate lyase acyl carrier protein [Clostridia bacterium]